MDLFGHTDVAAEKFLFFALCMTMIEVQHTKPSYSLSGAAVLIDSLAITSKSPQIHRLAYSVKSAPVQQVQRSHGSAVKYRYEHRS